MVFITSLLGVCSIVLAIWILTFIALGTITWDIYWVSAIIVALVIGVRQLYVAYHLEDNEDDDEEPPLGI
jgi:hypothetical protein